jgi:hypothetical protein
MCIAFVALVFNFFLSSAKGKYASFDDVELSVTEKNAFYDDMYYIKLGVKIENNANYPLCGWNGILTVKNQDGEELCAYEVELAFSISTPEIEKGESRDINLTKKHLRMDEAQTEFYLSDKDSLQFEFKPTEVFIKDSGLISLQADENVYWYALGNMFPLSIISVPINGLLFAGVFYAVYSICVRIGARLGWEE